jgi:hypothetical protein
MGKAFKVFDFKLFYFHGGFDCIFFVAGRGANGRHSFAPQRNDKK